MDAIFTGLGLSSAAGLNAYIPLLTLALAGRLGYAQLNSPYDALSSNLGIAVLVLLLAVEVFADKIPGVDRTSPRSDSDVPSSGKLITRSTTLPTSSMLGVWMQIPPSEMFSTWQATRPAGMRRWAASPRARTRVCWRRLRDIAPIVPPC